MKNKNSMKIAGLALFSVLNIANAVSQAQPCGSNLITNGDFEAGFTGFASGYTFKTDGPGTGEMIPENTFGVDVNVSAYHPSITGVGRSGKFLMVNGNTGTIKTVWSQDVNVVAGKTYNFSAFAQRLAGGNQAILRFSVGSDLLATYSPVAAGWNEVTGVYSATTTGTITLSIVDANLAAASNDFGIDDISFTQVCDEVPAGCFATDVYSFSQGLTRLGTAVNAERSNPENALSAPNGQNPAIYAPVQNFFSLGLGGNIVVGFENPIANGEGADVKIWESSASVNGERAFIQVSQDGIGYVPVGEIAQTGSISIPEGMDYIFFVKITDSTPAASAGNSQVADGYDVDAVECLNGAYTGNLINSCFATEYVSFIQGPKNDGISPVDAGRSNPSKALGMPQSNDTENFVSLGFGGEITLKFGSPIKNGDGVDVRVVESTFGNIGCNRYPETIRAFASQDGCNFIYLGEGCQDTDFDLGMLTWAQYIKLVDVSPVDGAYQGTPNGDAYDVDGILCLNGYEENPVLAEIPVGASDVISYTAGARKNGTPVTAARTNPDNALGAPQGTDVINFVSLGFGGNLVVKYDYVIFDNPLANDLRITETTFNNPSCASYPETAEIEGSLDGNTWTSLGTICLDGEIDINAAGAIQYLRITDRTPATSFNGSADGYDVDGIVVINQNCSTQSNDSRFADNVNTPDEVASIDVFPNPFQNEINLVIGTGDQDNSATIVVSNYLGQQVSFEKMNVASSSTVNHMINMSAFTSGIYFISVETNSTKEVIKVVKQ
jgi:hypothetical protein